MKRINVDITEKEYEELKRIADRKDVSVSFLLGAFVQDLTSSERRGGSDEHMYANDWLNRVGWKYR